MDRSDVSNDEQTAIKPRRSRAVRVVPIIIIVLMVVLAVVLVSRPTPGARTTTESSVRVIVSTASGSATSEFPVALQEGGDPEHEADHIIEPLQGIAGISTVTLDWSSDLVLTVEFDPTVVSSQDIANVLAKSGYLAPPPQ